MITSIRQQTDSKMCEILLTTNQGFAGKFMVKPSPLRSKCHPKSNKKALNWIPSEFVVSIVGISVSIHKSDEATIFYKHKLCFINLIKIVCITYGSRSTVVSIGSIIFLKDIVLKYVEQIQNLDCSLLLIDKITQN